MASQHDPSPSGSSIGACWVDGRLVHPGEPALLAHDHAVVVGDGVFETTRVVDGSAFALSRHLRRLQQSAAGLGLDEPSEGLVRLAVDAVLAADPDAGGRCGKGNEGGGCDRGMLAQSVRVAAAQMLSRRHVRRRAVAAGRPAAARRGATLAVVLAARLDARSAAAAREAQPLARSSTRSLTWPSTAAGPGSAVDPAAWGPARRRPRAAASAGGGSRSAPTASREPSPALPPRA